MKVYQVTWMFYDEDRYDSEHGSLGKFIQMNVKTFQDERDARKFFEDKVHELVEESDCERRDYTLNKNSCYGWSGNGQIFAIKLLHVDLGDQYLIKFNDGTIVGSVFAESPSEAMKLFAYSDDMKGSIIDYYCEKV